MSLLVARHALWVPSHHLNLNLSLNLSNSNPNLSNSPSSSRSHSKVPSPPHPLLMSHNRTLILLHILPHGTIQVAFRRRQPIFSTSYLSQHAIPIHYGHLLHLLNILPSMPRGRVPPNILITHVTVPIRTGRLEGNTIQNMYVPVKAVFCIVIYLTPD